MDRSSLRKRIRKWLNELGASTLFIEPGSPWENGYVESFNGKMRDELLNREIFYTLEEARVLIEGWRKEYNQVRPHSALGYRPPAPQAMQVISLAAPLAGSLGGYTKIRSGTDFGGWSVVLLTFPCFLPLF